jgi:dTDP-4-dehydrorhamnose 3,5-epimerase
MKAIATDLPGVLVIEPKTFRDGRGYFMETYTRKKFKEFGIDVEFVQDNHSYSARGVLRGLHFQVVREQAKLVRVIEGEIFDVAVDVRYGSPTFGKWSGARLSGENLLQLFVPAGFAHGFCVLSETAHVMYKCSDYYSPQDERGILWNDPDIGVRWPLGMPPELSEKDKKNPLLKDLQATPDFLQNGPRYRPL